jgi:hypothetical protein
MRSRFRLGTFADAIESKSDPTQRGFKVDAVVKVDYEPVIGKKEHGRGGENHHHFSSPLWVGPT